MLLLGLAAALSCAGVDEPAPVLTSTPAGESGPGHADVDVLDVKLEGGRSPLHPTAWTLESLGWPQLESLTRGQGAELMGALNQVGAPCDSCWQQGWSYSTCLKERPAACVDVLGQLLDRGVRLSAAGTRTAGLRDALTYDDAWVDVDWDALSQIASGWGPDDAPVRIVLIVDLQSPFCARVSDSWQALLDQGGDQVAVRVLYWTEERHERSAPAALAGEAAAAQGQQWAFTRLLLSRYQHLEDSDLLVAAAELGLDAAAFDLARAAPETAERLAAQRALAETWGVRTAPTSFVDGFRLRGARPHPQLASLLARALSDDRPKP
jgi:hypothetical protein